MPSVTLTWHMSSDRQDQRHATVLEVRFSSASEFVSEYAENLSAGGLFVRRAHNLEPLSEVDVEINLPGSGRFVVRARVAHVLDADTAARYNRQPGAGMQLVKTPAGFQDALMEHLGRLGRRRDSLVLVEDSACDTVLSTAGFRTELAELDRIVERTIGSKLLAIVVNRPSAKAFRDAIAISPTRIPVIGCNVAVDEEPLLAELDRLVTARPG